MKFDYQRYEIPKSPLDGATEIHRPEIMVHLIGGTGDLFCLGLVDTGADSVVIGQTIARLIGVKLSPGRRWPVHGFSGHTLEAVRGQLEIEMISRTESFCWQLPVAVVTYPDLASEETVVLGQSGFLEYFDVRFLGHAHVVELKPDSSLPGKRRRRVE